MLKRQVIKNIIIIFLIAFHPLVGMGQEKEPVELKLEFQSEVNFSGDCPLTQTRFESAVFHKAVNFHSRTISEKVDFKSAHFYGPSRFDHVVFRDSARFNETLFDKQAYFHHSKFAKQGLFFGTVFNEKATFNNAVFNKTAFFHNVQFQDTCNFTSARFKEPANFLGTHFDGPTYFSHARFDSDITFYYAEINAPLTLENASAKDFIFHGAIIRDKIYLGSTTNSQVPFADFTKASFTEPENSFHPSTGKKTNGGEIILVGPAKLDIQIEKFPHLSLLDTLDYFTKKYIIATLKEECFAGENQASERFELDYILAKSTMHQDKSSVYGRTKFYQVHKWPKWFATELYYLTMELGYRPFDLLYWAFGLVIIFTIIYSIWIPERLKEFIALEWKHKKTKESTESASICSLFYENVLISFYFSASVFFALRFNKDIFNFFERNEKMWISIEWLLGIIFYVAFFALAQSGSILHRLLGLFV